MVAWAEVSYSKALSERRLDSEYYKPAYLALDRLVQRRKWQTWGRFGGRFIVGPFGSVFNVENFVQDRSYRYIRGKDIKPFFTENDDNVHISADHFHRLSQYAVRSGDLLISVVGTLGNVCIVSSDDVPAVFSCKSTAYRSSDIDPYYLSAYLNCVVGSQYLLRKQRGAVQTGLNLEDLKSIPIPRFSEQIEESVAQMIRDAYQSRNASKCLYSYAQRILEDESCLGKINLSPCVGYESRLFETFHARRWDSEFYKPKYKHVSETVLTAKKVKVERLIPVGRLFSYLTNGHTPLYHDLMVGEVLFLTAEHVSDFRLDFETDKRILQRHHDTELARTALREGDILVTIKGKVGNCAVVRNCPRVANINQDVALIRLRKGIHPYFFAAWFNSLMGKQLVEQRSTGSINPFLGLGNLRGMPFPVIEEKEQQRIGDLVQETVEKAQSAEQETGNLLESAKRRVEELVEQAAKTDGRDTG